MPLLSTRANASARGYGMFGAAVGGSFSFDSISTATVGAGGASTITFSSIPNTYKHLQIRVISRDDRSAAVVHQTYRVTYNSDTTANYTTHAMYGQSLSGGAVVDQYGNANSSGMDVYSTAPAVASGIFGTQIIDILDYSSTNKYKTQRSLGGSDNNGTGMIAFMSGLWRSTSAVSTITIIPAGSATFQQYSSFALYGIKG